MMTKQLRLIATAATTTFIFFCNILPSYGTLLKRRERNRHDVGHHDDSLTSVSIQSSPRKHSFQFNIDERYASLKADLPEHTAIYSHWPRKDLQTDLPLYLPIAVMTDESDDYVHEDDSTPHVLMGKPIHVIAGDELEIDLVNNLPGTGLSLHFHGFEMANALEYDGVVGLTQCAISPRNQFSYKFVVEEEVGTYWYHTHSGNLGVESHNMIKGPLIVHPNTAESRELVEMMNTNVHETMTTATKHRYRSSLSYRNERILFFSDGFVQSDSILEMHTMGGLFPPVPENDDGFIAAAMEYQFGTVNGKLREVVHVSKGDTYKFRLLNGGSHFAYRISIDSFPLRIVASDSTPVEPFIVDEVILHNAERFDAEITIPDDDSVSVGDTFWIRADTLESRKQGYENGVRAILHIVEKDIDIEEINDNDIQDPTIDIVRGLIPVEERVTMNCYSQIEISKAEERGKGACLPITALLRSTPAHEYDDQAISNSIVRTVDFDSNFAPMHAFFTRIEDGDWKQFTGPSGTNMLQAGFDPARDLHPNTAIMDVPAFSSVIIIWRSRTIMDHPMHLHGYKMEILEVFAADRKKDCNLAKCNLEKTFNTPEKIRELDSIPVGTKPVKDTFIIPSGGAVATRIFTRDPAAYFAHCHMEVHRQDGMAFILNVGNYQAPKDGSWLPPDFPDCETKFLLSKKHEEPHCDCYIDEDAVLDTMLDSTYKCSRKYLCFHEKSQVASVTKNNNLGGFQVESSFKLSGRVISGIFVGIIILCTLVFTHVLPWWSKDNRKREFTSFKRPLSIVETVQFSKQLQMLTISQWSSYHQSAVNVLRVVEVVGLGILTGILFEKVGSDHSSTGFGEKTSLLFFSTTLWSQTRMFPAIQSYFKWAHSDCFTLKSQNYDVLPICLSRMIAVTAAESWWPFIFVLCAYPLASMFGNVGIALMTAVFLALNNMCYIALGALVGTILPTVSLAMISATLFAQTTVICAGFFTNLPVAVTWVRYISPIFYTFKGVVKLSYRWDDTFKCVKGQSAVGPNDCYLEESALIDDYKQRGINVATFGDASSSHVYQEAVFLVLIFVIFQLLIFCFQYFALSRRDDSHHSNNDEEIDKEDEERNDNGKTIDITLHTFYQSTSGDSSSDSLVDTI